MSEFVYKPSRFMLPTSHYDEKKADKAVRFIENLCHTKGKWAGEKFLLLPWQEQIVRDIFGIVNEQGYRQFRECFTLISKKNGKSELAAAIALYLLFADGEASPEVYGAANDRAQASLVYDVAKQMVLMTPALNKRAKVLAANKRIACYANNGYYQVLSAESATKDGMSISGLVIDEIHAMKTRDLYDVLTKGSGDARQQPLFFIITTAGTNKESVCYELFLKAKDILAGKREDPSFYPVIYALDPETDDWNDEETWYKSNPSLGETINIDRMRDAYREALQNPADEATFKRLRLGIWNSGDVAWIPDHVYAKGDGVIDLDELYDRDCYAGLDLSSTSDITAFVLVFPPRRDDEQYIVLPYFWLPEDTMEKRCRRDHVMYDTWAAQGYINVTPGNVIDYRFIQDFIERTCERYHVLEIAYDRWNATMLVQNLLDEGLPLIPHGQGYKDMSPPSKEVYKLLMEGKILHGGNPVLRWMAGNVVMEQDPAGNIKPTKAKAVEKIDGIVAMIMAMGRAVINEGSTGSVYDERGLFSF